MLKKRIIATLIVREGIVVQSINFRKYLPVGKPEIAIEFLNSWGVDEIVVVDITASKDRGRKDYRFVNGITRSCFVPLTVGGGIDCIEDIRSLLNLGADKICINSHCLGSPEFITEAADIFGSQCIVVSIDVAGNCESDYFVYDASRGVVTDLRPLEWAKEVQKRGAGEIYLTSVERDGSKAGYDLKLVDTIASGVEIPVIASGGAGNAGDIHEVFSKTGASAASAANFFHFFEHSVITTKAALTRSHDAIRLNTHASYAKADFDGDFRLRKLADEYLRDLLFERIQKEVI
ncbi:imidazole glycerol phosphate synthase subunit HisF [Geobacter sp. DSM 9736]|uniref:imidazole glycerol phosphate synthase subunit HisF n=1 Tax=Geobacter sp. DSM 9736 TaxID=1277350 RepID=UPI000B511BA3|nr:imidazole glycerol phosphate synthase cyclase subunit [Geobacter sp. DSM 9736]SNB45048.1 cyclase [Geobacter sp. DSM 9736]